MLDFRNVEDMLNTYSFRDRSRPPFVVDSFSTEDRYHIDRLLPRLDTQHKEALFSVKPILVEGYTDKQIFSLSIEKHDDIHRDPSSAIVSLDGKENVNSFFRFCQEIGLDPRVVVDLDAIFHGGLRQTLSGIEKVNSKIQDAGAGSNLMDAIGTIDTNLGILVDELQSQENDGSLNGSLLNARNCLDTVDKNYKQRYILYRAICLDEQASFSEFGQDSVREVLGGMNSVLQILSDCGYHFLREGELEDYLTEGTPLTGVSRDRKLKILVVSQSPLEFSSNWLP